MKVIRTYAGESLGKACDGKRSNSDMTFQVFVRYGDVVAKQIAENLGHYLRRCGLNTFVASTDPA